MMGHDGPILSSRTVERSNYWIREEAIIVYRTREFLALYDMIEDKLLRYLFLAISPQLWYT